MSPRRSLEPHVDRALWHWHERSRASAAQHGAAPPHPGLTICLEREAGTRGATIAHDIGKMLGWPVYAHELLEKIAQEMHLQTQLLESVDGRRESWLQEVMESFSQIATVNESAYVQHLIRTVLALGTHGECVIVGRGAGFILPRETTLRVRLIGREKDRAAVVTRKLQVPPQEAVRRMKALDAERRVFVRDHFLKDPRDPHNYDLIVNTSTYSTARCAELIVEAAHRMQSQAGATQGTTS